jgi:DNA ligase (NAD+)
VRGLDFETETKKVLFLSENKFETLKDSMARIKCRERSPKEVAGAVQKYMDRIDRENLHFDVDGVVFKLNDIAVAEAMGHTDSEGRRSKANRAIKFPAEQKETILEGIEESIGRTGAFTPVGLLKPVRLAGTTVKRVSLHNIKELKRLGIKYYGCTVLVEKAGDIIPKVIRMVKEGNVNSPIRFPEKCPICGSVMEWDDTDTTVWCRNDLCPAQINGNIEHWFKKIGSKGIGDGIISKLTEGGYVKCLSDMYKLQPKDKTLETLFGPRAYEKILESVDSIKELPLAKFIEALGIGKVGRTAKDIVGIAPTIKAVDDLVALNNGNALLSVAGFQTVKVKGFVDGWIKLRSEIDELLKHITIKEAKLNSNKFNGQSYCFTGSFSSPTRKEMEKMVEDNGGKNSSVSKTLTALVWDEEMTGGKYDKAKKLGVPIIKQKEFLDKLI